MRNKKIAVVKNGYDVMRIIEMNSDNENCELKIVLFIDNCDIDIKYLKLFSTIEKQKFDKTKKFELTYHKKSTTQPTKIHLKFDDGVSVK